MAAKNRMIVTKMWSDTWIATLEPVEKLLWLYLLTNEHTKLSGIYEVPLNHIATETGIDKEIVEKMLARFAKDKKIACANGYLYIRNFIKHQKTTSNNIKIGIKNALAEVPQDTLDTLCKEYGYPIDRLPLNLNLNLNLNLKYLCPQDISDLVDFWNSYTTGQLLGNITPPNKPAMKALLKACHGVTSEIEAAFVKIADKHYKKADCQKAIENYIGEILNRNSDNPKNDYYKHRFTFFEFFKQSNGFSKFINK